MKKYVCILLFLLLVSGCGKSEDKSTDENVEKNMNQYATLEDYLNSPEGVFFYRIESNETDQASKDDVIKQAYYMKSGLLTEYTVTKETKEIKLSDLQGHTNDEIKEMFSERYSNVQNDQVGFEWNPKLIITEYSDNSGNSVEYMGIGWLAKKTEDEKYYSIGRVLFDYGNNYGKCSFKIYDDYYSGFVGPGIQLYDYKYEYIITNVESLPDPGLSGDNVILDKSSKDHYNYMSDEEWVDAAKKICGLE